MTDRAIAQNQRDMKFRRHAIAAPGHIRDRNALPTLETILKSKDEIFYLSGDTLRAIYLIDSNLAKRYAKELRAEHDKKTVLDAVEKDAEWLFY